MKILHLLASDKFSGAEHVVLDIIKGLSNRHQLIYVSPNGDIERVLEENNIKCILLKKMSYFEIYNVIRQYKPDVIHAHDYRASCIAAFIPFRGKIISHIHNNNIWARKINVFTIIYYLALMRINKVVAVSKAVIDEFIFFKKMLGKSVVVKNSINISYIERKYLNENQDPKCYSDILFVGRLVEEKDPIRFIRIIKNIIKKKNNLVVRIIGDGMFFDKINSLILDLNLQNNVYLMGFKSNPYIYMKNTKLLMVTSRWEGFGLVAMEAMLLGTPVLGTGVGGLKNIINNYCQEWICESDEEFIEKGLAILNNRSKYINKDNIIKYAEQENCFEEFIDTFDRIYKE